MCHMNVAIVEDVYEDRSKLSRLFDVFCKKSNNVSVNLSFFNSTNEFIESYKTVYDLVLISMDMSGINGLKTAQNLRKCDAAVSIVLMGHDANDAVNGYYVDADAFLCKPLEGRDFANVMLREVNKHDAMDGSMFFTTTKKTIRLNMRDVLFLESNKHKCTLFTRSDKYEMWDTLKRIEEMLAPYGFFRSSSCNLVNLRNIDSVEGESIYIGGYELKASRSKKSELLDALDELWHPTKQS